MNKIHIFFSSDEVYMQHLAVSIASILCTANKDDGFCFYILDGGISEKSKEKINKLKRIKSFEIEYILMNDEEFKNLPLMSNCGHVTLPTYYRFKLARLKPELDKILYMDCDIVVKKNLSELWNEDISEFFAGAVEDASFPKLRQDNKERLECDKYFNAGILLLNLQKWREFDIETKCFEFVEHEKEKILWNDQDVLNAIFKDKTKFLHPKWNLQTWALNGGSYEYSSKEECDEAIKNPAIIHYTTRFKPWDAKLKHQLQNEYFKYLNLTEWKNYIIKYNFTKFLNIFSKNKNMLPYKSYEQICDLLMNTDFQQRIDKLAKKYQDKNIIIYGAGNAFNVIYDNFDLSKLNLAGIADIKFEDGNTYKEFNTISPKSIANNKPAVVLISMLESHIASDFFKKDLFPKYGKFKFEPFVI
jgi:lipopolysaccharide biosynthesis glycosyltransferase